MSFVIYTSDNCIFCVRAKTVLRARDLEFEERDVTDSLEEMQAHLIESIGMVPNTVPQIFDGDDYVGGYDELLMYLLRNDIP